MAPSRAKRRLKDARPQGSAVKPQKREVKPRCSVCSTIIKVLKEPARRPSSDLDLGSFESVMVSTTCKVHPQMFRRMFRLNIDTLRIKTFSIYTYYSGENAIKALHIADSVDMPRTISSLKLSFLPVPSREDTHLISKFVNPHWIDHNIFRHWKRDCNSRNNQICHVGIANAQLAHNRPAWLIDTWRLCLTPGDSQVSYVALSYVWGQTTFFKTCKANIDQLQIDLALSDSHRRLGVPRTIADAIALVGLLEERYLWVDALCIVQDDQNMKHDQINNMASIFANATVTIIAKGGEHANHGLRGLRGISEPRSISQEVFKLGKSYNVVRTIPLGLRPRRTFAWADRGWTFQEQLFSRRFLQFDGDSVRWNCACSTFSEINGKLNILGKPDNNFRLYADLTLNSLPAFPDIRRYEKLATEYNGRDLSYPRDALAAFAGITSVLSKTFYAGFICALPVLVFDMALLWRPSDTLIRRSGPKPSAGRDLDLPSWSWVTGKGDFRLYFENVYVKKSDLEYWVRNFFPIGPRTVPMVQWYSRSCIAGHPRPIRAPWELQELKERSLQGLGDVPKGWTRFDYDGEKPIFGLSYRYFYKHESDPTTEFWYPIPLCSPELVPTQNYDRLLSCRTQRTWLFLSEPKMHLIYIDNHRFTIRDVQGKWAGIINSDEELPPEDLPQLGTPPPSHSDPHLRCELVAISRGYAYEGASGWGMAEWNLKERPKTGGEGSKYEFYNVLWVEWEEGIAYRKGVGRIEKAMWEAQELEWIDLVLG